MPRRRGGFTIIEVTLFLAISGFLIVGLIVGTSATVARQRYNDSVQDLAEFFRREYSAAINIENGRTDPIESNACGRTEGTSGTISNNDTGAGGVYAGRSNCLIYGRLVVFGELDDDARIYSYDVVGRELDDAEVVSTNALKASLERAAINVLVRTDPTNPASATCSYQPVGQSQYTPQWLSRVEDPADSDLFEGSLLIVRSPSDGSIHTLFYPAAIQVQDAISSACTAGSATSLLGPEVLAEFVHQTIDVCVGSDDVFAMSGVRRAVRLERDGHNSTAVELIDQDSEENPCRS